MRIWIFILLLALSTCYIGKEIPVDQTVWEYAEPSEVGIDNESLLSQNLLIESNGYEFINGMIITKGNKLIFENYYNGVNRLKKQPLGRASVQLAIIAIGIAKTLDIIDMMDSIYHYLPQYELIFTNDERKKAITIQSLFSHRTGLSWNGGIVSEALDRNDFNRMKNEENWVEYLLTKPLEALPNQRFNQNDAIALIIPPIIENASSQNFMTFMQKNLFTPLNITDITIKTDLSGNTDLLEGVEMTLLDWTKIGYLMVNDGLWQSRKIIDPQFALEARTSQKISEFLDFGYLWRLFGERYDNIFGIDREEIIFIAGKLGEQQYLVPSESLVVSIFAENYDKDFCLIEVPPKGTVCDPSFNLFQQVSLSFSK